MSKQLTPNHPMVKCIAETATLCYSEEARITYVNDVLMGIWRNQGQSTSFYGYDINQDNIRQYLEPAMVKHLQAVLLDRSFRLLQELLEGSTFMEKL